MDYKKAKSKLIYSNQMKLLHGKESKVKGFISAGEYARNLEKTSDFVALINGLDADYCSFLAIAKNIGIPPYGIEGEEALKQLLGDSYDQTSITVDFLEKIIGEKMDDRVYQDIRFLNTKKGERTPEAEILERTEEVIELFSLLNPKEREKMGGPLLQSTLLKGIKKDENGNFEHSDLYKKIDSAVKSRKPKINQDRLKQVKSKFQDKIIDATVNEQVVDFNRVLGE